jgi:hypothetical protein
MRTLLSAILLTLGTSCGWLQTGNTGGGLDPRPDGDVVAQGPLSSIKSGYSISGTVVIYRLTGSGVLVIRLEGLTVTPAENTFQMTAEVNGGSDFTTYLRFVRGNANYNTSLVSPATISRVILSSPTIPAPQEIATATLTSP